MGFLNYDEKSGLVVKTKSQILDDLLEIVKQSYGQNYVVAEGTEMYAFLDTLSAALTETGNAAKAVYDAFGFITATGTPLDVLCSLAGIYRKDGESDTALRARYFKFLYTPSVSTEQGLEQKLLDYVYEYTDSDNKIYKINPVKEVKIINNDTNSIIDAITGNIATTSSDNNYKVLQHSIWVIYKESADLRNIITNNNDYNNSVVYTQSNLSNIVLNYKSLGCGVKTSTLYNFNDVVVYITRAVNIPTSISLTLNLIQNLNQSEINAIELNIKNNIVNYINGLKLGEDILYSAIQGCVYKAYSDLNYTDYIFSLFTININNTALTVTNAHYLVKPDNFVSVTDSNITFTWNKPTQS